MKRYISLITIVILCLCLCSCSGGSNDMSDNLFDFEIKINGIVYKLPEKIDTFTQNGWAFPESFDQFESTVTPGNLEGTYLSISEDDWFTVEIFNGGDSDMLLKDCPVGRLTYSFDGSLEISTAGGFNLNGKTLDEVKEKYGEPMSQADYSTYTEIIYDKDESSGIYDRVTFRFDKDTKIVNYIDMVSFY